MDLVASLFLAACTLFGSGCELPEPQMVVVPHEEMQVLACGSWGCGEGYVVLGLWYDGGGAIFVNEEMPPEEYTGIPEDVFRAGVIVHELVHYLQYVKGHPVGRCERELEAYTLEALFLKLMGYEPEPIGFSC